MYYISTRGKSKKLTFSEIVFEGLAPDGGLFVPEVIPRISEDRKEEWKKLNYLELALEIFKIFAPDIPAEDLRLLIEKSYKNFRHPEITPLVKIGDLYILELFHGPTFAFKDIALQFLGNLFEYLLQKNNKKINILGATSGDTGAAAIYGVMGKENIAIFILFPYNKVSPIQALMMTTVLSPNVHNLAVLGSFDDCQRIVKEIFMEHSFKKQYNLTSINSINFARIMAQVVYYIYAYFRVCEREGVEELWFSVPTGNFGNIFAGYLAKRLLGHGIEKLILATNENDILARFVNKGDYSVREVIPTISPAMDIQIASNFERYLYYFYEEDTQKTAVAMETFSKEKKLSFSADEIKKVQKDFLACSVSQSEILETIRTFYEKWGYILDPHTAVGVRAALSLKEEKPLICLSTAHPAKFPETVKKALKKEFALPEEIEKLKKKPQKYEIFEGNTEKVKNYLLTKALI